MRGNLYQASVTASAGSSSLHADALRAESAALNAIRAQAVAEAIAQEQDQGEAVPGADLGQYEHSSRPGGALPAGAAQALMYVAQPSCRIHWLLHSLEYRSRARLFPVLTCGSASNQLQH